LKEADDSLEGFVRDDVMAGRTEHFDGVLHVNHLMMEEGGRERGGEGGVRGVVVSFVTI